MFLACFNYYRCILLLLFSCPLLIFHSLHSVHYPLFFSFIFSIKSFSLLFTVYVCVSTIWRDSLRFLLYTLSPPLFHVHFTFECSFQFGLMLSCCLREARATYRQRAGREARAFPRRNIPIFTSAVRLCRRARYGSKRAERARILESICDTAISPLFNILLPYWTRTEPSRNRGNQN